MITSVDNPRLKEARKLQRRRHRHQLHALLLEGVRLLRENALERAQAVFAAVRDSTADSSLRTKATARVAELGGMIEFDRGMKAYERKDYEAAAAAFERARALATTDELREKAAKNAALMRNAAKQTGAGRPAAPKGS